MKVIICGAGLAGLALACLLDRAGWDVTLVERSPKRCRGGYMIDFFGPGFDAADAMGLLPRLRELAHPIDNATYVDDAGRTVARLDYHQLADTLGGRLLSAMRSDLELALWEILGTGVDVRFGCTVNNVYALRSLVVTLSDDSTLEADLLIGADGIHSRVRELTFGPEARFLRYLGMHTAAYTFRDRRLHEQLGQHFVLTDTLNRQIGCYAIQDEHVAVFAVHRSPDQSIPRDPQNALRDTYRDLGWIIPQVIDRCPRPPDLYYDLVAQIEMQHWSKERVVLVGDACSAVSLLAGQGASIALAAAHELAHQLAQRPDIGDALEQYEARMTPIVRNTQAIGRRIASWFVPTSSTRLRARRLALQLSHLPGLHKIVSKALVGRRTTLIEDTAQRAASD